MSMKLILTIMFGLIAMTASAATIECDCEVQVYSPMTGSHQMSVNTLKTYTLESFSSYSLKNQKKCRLSCEEKFLEDMPTQRLNALLATYAQGLITEGAVGYNCTGLTTLKFPVRVKASMGQLGLGNVADVIQVINHEEICF